METATAYIVYHADCPTCGDVNDLGDADPEGKVECVGCRKIFIVTGVQ